MRWPIIQACRALNQGGVIAYPTEAVWGLGCDPYDEASLQTILAIKRRDQGKGVLLVASRVSQIEYLLKGVQSHIRTKMLNSWSEPYPVTWLIPHRGQVPAQVHGQHSTVAVRVSHHPVVKSLCDVFGGPLVSTSANFSGHPAALNIMQVRKHLGYYLDYIVPGDLGGFDRPSQIIDAASGRIIRA